MEGVAVGSGVFERRLAVLEAGWPRLGAPSGTAVVLSIVTSVG